MCNRYRMSASQRELAEQYGFDAIYPEDENYPRPELFPKSRALVVTTDGGKRAVSGKSWGFPIKVRGKRIDKVTGKPMMLDKHVTNLRNYHLPMWHRVLVDPAQRCLVPFTTFSEPDIVPGPDSKSVLRWFSVPSQPVASLAGIWQRTPKGDVFAFLTCGYSGGADPEVEKDAAAAHIVGAVHPKACPVILFPEDEERWLQAPIEDALALASPFPSQLMAVE